MGVAGADLPTIAKTATGRYTVTYPASWVDAIGVTENIGFLCAGGTVQHLTTFGTVQCTVAASVISVAIFDAAGAATDLGGAVTVAEHARKAVYALAIAHAGSQISPVLSLDSFDGVSDPANGVLVGQLSEPGGRIAVLLVGVD